MAMAVFVIDSVGLADVLCGYFWEWVVFGRVSGNGQVVEKGGDVVIRDLYDERGYRCSL